VSVEALIESLAIPVRTVSLPLFFTAALVNEDGLPVIILNWAKSEPERRSALAHVIGHVLLVMHGDNSYPREAPEHGEADLVARELMLPTAMVIEQARLWFNDYRYLARLFGVSEDVMLERMREMGLVRGPEGDVWVF
jgi:Zn-dependent peptidase ImmA (M78 family)